MNRNLQSRQLRQQLVGRRWKLRRKKKQKCMYWYVQLTKMSRVQSYFNGHYLQTRKVQKISKEKPENDCAIIYSNKFYKCLENLDSNVSKAICKSKNSRNRELVFILRSPQLTYG